jgi:hypothetical protein
MPSSGAPPPVTIATLPARPKSSLMVPPPFSPDHDSGGVGVAP